jgi:hypothetical protein
VCTESAPAYFSFQQSEIANGNAPHNTQWDSASACEQMIGPLTWSARLAKVRKYYYLFLAYFNKALIIIMIMTPIGCGQFRECVVNFSLDSQVQVKTQEDGCRQEVRVQEPAERCF